MAPQSIVRPSGPLLFEENKLFFSGSKKTQEEKTQDFSLARKNPSSIIWLEEGPMVFFDWKGTLLWLEENPPSLLRIEEHLDV